LGFFKVLRVFEEKWHFGNGEWSEVVQRVSLGFLTLTRCQFKSQGENGMAIVPGRGYLSIVGFIHHGVYNNRDRGVWGAR